MLTLSLVACGGGGTTQNPGGTISNPWWETTGELEMDGGKVVFDNVNLSLMTVVNGADYTAFKEIINKFNTEYKGKIQIDVTNTTHEKFVNTVTTAIAQNQNPADILMSHQDFLQMLATDYQAIQPFDEAMEKSGISIPMSNFADGLSKYADLGYEGYTFGIPVDAQSMVVLYNKELLGNNELPTNHAEVIALCNQLKGQNITPVVWPAGEETETNFIAEYVWTTALLQNGATFYASTGDSVAWDEGANATAFQNAIKAIRDFQSTGVSLTDSKTKATNTFVNGNAAFFVYEPWLVNNVIKSFAEKKGITVEEAMENYIGATSIANWFAIDANAPTANMIFGDSHSFAMSKSVKTIEKKAAIVEFVKWFTTNAEVGVEWAKAGHVTASKPIGSNATYTGDAFISDFTTKFYPNINNIACAGNTVYYNEIFNGLTSLFITLRDADGSSDATIIERSVKAINDTIAALQAM
jgi:maltose-binding protein MalE